MYNLFFLKNMNINNNIYFKFNKKNKIKLYKIIKIKLRKILCIYSNKIPLFLHIILFTK